MKSSYLIKTMKSLVSQGPLARKFMLIVVASAITRLIRELNAIFANSAVYKSARIVSEKDVSRWSQPSLQRKGQEENVVGCVLKSFIFEI